MRVRGWHVKLQRMFSPEEMAADQLTLLPTGQFINVARTLEGSTIYPVDKFIPLLSTGLKDKNGVEIYQDDFLKSGDDIMRVVWVNELASFGLVKSGWMHTHFFQEAVNPSDCEIVGNSHQNPELLEG